MASAEDYANWIVKNADKKGTPEFDTVAKAYQLARSQSAETPATATPRGGFKPELGDLSGMPEPRPKAVQGLTVAQERGNLPQYDAGEVAAAVGRGVARVPGQIYDLGAMLSNISPSTLLGVTPRIEPKGVEATNEALGLKQTPAEYAPFEFVGGMVGPSAVTKAFGVPVRAGLGALESVQNWLNPKTAALLQAAEGRGQQIISALRAPNEFVPGSVPTAGQAAVPAAAPRYAALQEEVAKIMPAAYYGRETAQNTARLGSVRTIGQDEAALQSARATREGTTAPMYDAARKGTQPVDTGPVLDKIDDLIAKNPGNPELLAEMQRIRKGLVIPETKVTPELARTNAEEISSTLDGIKAALKREDNKHITGQLTEIKDMLVDAIPNMKPAQETFKALSKPVNKMEVGQYLEGKLASPLADETLRPGVFATAMENAPATIKRATGMPRFQSMSQILDPADMAKLEAIRADLARQAEFVKQARVGRGAGENIPATGEAQLPNLMSRVASIANNVMKTLQGRIDRKVAIELATEMLNPQLAANAMEKALAFQASQAARRATVNRAGDFANKLALMSGATSNVNSLAGQ